MRGPLKVEPRYQLSPHWGDNRVLLYLQVQRGVLPLARHVEHVPGLLHALPDPGKVLVRVVERGLGFGRIVDSEIEAPNVFVDPV